jgi:hypothetical protein
VRIGSGCRAAGEREGIRPLERWLGHEESGLAPACSIS